MFTRRLTLKDSLRLLHQITDFKNPYIRDSEHIDQNKCPVVIYDIMQLNLIELKVPPFLIKLVIAVGKPVKI